MLFLTRRNKSRSCETAEISFGLHRKESKVVVLRNITLLPLAWRITSLEHLGEDFTVSTVQGTIAPKAEYSLQVHFQPSKPINIKKAIRLEVRLCASSVLIIKMCTPSVPWCTHCQHTHTRSQVPVLPATSSPPALSLTWTSAGPS